jgi:ABC-type nitrate/sulfonate/bicarbonate transport system substrate-binding protein
VRLPPPSSGANLLATLPGPARRAGGRTLRIGFVPLADAAPLLVAEAVGLFAATGVRVALSAEGAWAGIRDKLAFGALDAAHLLGPMPIAAALGLGGGPRRRLTVAAGLGQNGNIIVLSHALAAAVGAFRPPLGAAAFAAALRLREAAGRASARLAVVFPFSSHNYLLRHWLAAGGRRAGRRAGGRDAARHQPRARGLLRRQGVRPRRPGRLARRAADQEAGGGRLR